MTIMEAEVLKLNTRQKREDSSDSGDSDLEVVPIAPVRKTLVIEGGNVGNDGMKEENSDPVSLYFNPSDSSVYVRNGAAVGIAMSSTEEVREIYLKNIFMMPPNHELFCPNCNVGINKVLFCATQPHNVAPSLPHQPPRPPVIQPVHENLTPENPDPHQGIEAPVRCSECFSLLIQKGKEFITGLVSSRVPPGSGQDVSIAIPVSPITNPPPPVMPPPPPVPEDSKGWEILKSVVYGGLAELLASLSVVTSAASADATTLSIVALGIANLIGGLSVLGHNLKDLRASQPTPREQGSEGDTENDKYYELLGKRENFFLHAFFAILSFLIFGLVPPIVYGFSFSESDDKDLKLAAVAATSLICITLLGIAKAHIQRRNSYVTYLTTVAFYVTSGVLASLLTYVAGAFMKRLVEQLGWFQPKSNVALSSLAEMSMVKSGWGSY
ncbi:membrane protein of ER body 2 [Cajanus cajan]|nr:membrane protein of ER body 2 [Cajanus cajan]